MAFTPKLGKVVENAEPTEAAEGSPSTGFTPKLGRQVPNVDQKPASSFNLFQSVASAGKAIGKGLADVALQPARFLERTGKQIGTMGLSPEQKAKYENYVGPGLQEKALGEGYETPAYENVGQTLGGGVQAAANLASPAVGGIGKLAAQGAALSAGKSMEEGRDIGSVVSDAATGGLISGATGGILKGAGKVVEKGAKALTDQAAKNVIKKAFPVLTNVPKSDTAWAQKNAFRVVPKMKAVAEAVERGETEAAESILRSDLLTTAKNVFSRAKQTAEKNYDDAVSAVVAANPEAKGSLEAMRGSVRALAKEAGESVTPDDEFALNALYKTIDNHGDASIKGFIGLKRKLFPIIERTEQGSPARRIANLMYEEVDNELDRITEGGMKPINKAYREFKDAAFEVKPLWSEMAKEDSQRNFVAGLSGQAKTGSMDAIKKLEKMAGTGDELAQEIRATRIAKAMNWEKAPPGSRIRDQLVSALFAGVGGTLGSVAGPIGTGLGASAGLAAGIKLTSPKFLSQFLFDDLAEQGVKVSGSTRAAIGKAMQNPQFMQALLRASGQGSAPQNQE